MKVVVCGAKGKMGQAIVDFVKNHSLLTLVGAADVGDSLEQCLKEKRAEVVIDFTEPESRMINVQKILYGGASAVVGTTGFTPKDLQQIAQWVQETDKGCFIAPNFIVGNVLMQQFAQKAAFYFENAEIIEYHHEQKRDYPSGTAVKTAELMSTQRKRFNTNTNDCVANVAGARGGDMNGIKIHAVRMPGFIASQEVILGDVGQYLTIRHDSIDRKAYMPGILLAAQYIVDKAELVYGLEHLL